MVVIDWTGRQALSDLFFPQLSSENPALWQTLFIVEVILECALGLYLADMVSGIVHLCLDYEVGTNEELRRHAEYTIDDVKAFERDNSLYLEAKKRDKYLWNFHVHHDATWPAADTNCELFRQMVAPAAPWYIASVILAYLGIIPPMVARMWLFGVAIAMFTQFTHFGAHARHRGLVKGFFGARLVCKLQDWHIILHPETHRSHHVHFDRDFCILNGSLRKPVRLPPSSPPPESVCHGLTWFSPMPPLLPPGRAHPHPPQVGPTPWSTGSAGLAPGSVSGPRRRPRPRFVASARLSESHRRSSRRRKAGLAPPRQQPRRLLWAARMGQSMSK
jgi:hypothetical protein